MILSNGKSFLKEGLLYELEDLYGVGYGYGEQQYKNCLGYKKEILNSEEIEIFSIYTSEPIKALYLPGNLKFGSTFESALKEFSILDDFNKGNDGRAWTINFYSENGENLYVELTTIHGTIYDNNIKTAAATISFSKYIQDREIECHLRFFEGKLTSVYYVLTVSNGHTKESYANNKMMMKFFKEEIDNNLCEGTIDSIIFYKDSAELTITARSKLGKSIKYEERLNGLPSADVIVDIGDFTYQLDVELLSI